MFKGLPKESLKDVGKVGLWVIELEREGRGSFKKFLHEAQKSDLCSYLKPHRLRLPRDFSEIKGMLTIGF